MKSPKPFIGFIPPLTYPRALPARREKTAFDPDGTFPNNQQFFLVIQDNYHENNTHENNTSVHAALLVFVGGMIGTTTTANGQTGPCTLDTLCDWTPWQIKSRVVTIYFGPYPCNVEVNYNFRWCPGDPPKIQINVWGWTLPDSLCLDAYNYYFSLPDSTQWALSDNIWRQATNRVGEAEFEDIRSQNPPSTNYNCINSSGCASLNGYLQVAAVYARCIEYIEVMGSLLHQGGNCPGAVYRIDCESEGCCMQMREMCFDTNTGQIRVCESWTQIGSPQCSGNGSFTPPLGCDIVWRTGCKTWECSN